jgi:hypothetical protein
MGINTLKRFYLAAFICISSSVALSADVSVNGEGESLESSKELDTTPESVRSSVGNLWEKTSEKASALSKTITGEKDSAAWRGERKYALLGAYSHFDLYIPAKIGFILIFNESKDKSWELEYLQGRVSAPLGIVDLGSFRERRVSVFKRSFWGTNSFSGYFGLSWNKFDVILGDETLSKLSNGAAPSGRALSLESIGINMGLGNRWTIGKGFTFGVDWLGWSQPLFTLNQESSVLDQASNGTERERIDKILNVATYFPRIYVLKMQLGWTF